MMYITDFQQNMQQISDMYIYKSEYLNRFE